MKIIRIISELDFGGVEQVLANSLYELNKRDGLEIKVLVLGKGGKIADQLINEGFSIKVLGLNPRIPNFLLVKTLKKELLSMKPEVVHCQGGESNFHGILAASLSNVPRVIAEEIGIPNHHSYWKYIFKWIYKKADQVIAISEAVKEEIVGLREVKAEKVKIIYNPICNSGDQERLVSIKSLQQTKEEHFDFVTTCRLVPIKNLDRLIQAFAGLLKVNFKRNIKLKIIGEGPEREKLERLSEKLEIEGNIEFFGFQSNVFPFLIHSDAFVLPSLREGSSVSLAEAMSMGLPSIVTQIGGAKEVLGKSDSGILIDPTNTVEIQSAMQQIIDLKREERLKMGERAKQEAKRFSTVNYVDSLLSIYGFSEIKISHRNFD